MIMKIETNNAYFIESWANASVTDLVQVSEGSAVA